MFSLSQKMQIYLTNCKLPLKKPQIGWIWPCGKYLSALGLKADSGLLAMFFNVFGWFFKLMTRDNRCTRITNNAIYTDRYDNYNIYYRAA